MGDGNAETNPRAQDGLPFLHCTENFGIGAARVVHQMTRELGDNPGFVPRGQGYYDPVWREQLAQKHGMTWDGMESKLYRAPE